MFLAASANQTMPTSDVYITRFRVYRAAMKIKHVVTALVARAPVVLNAAALLLR